MKGVDNQDEIVYASSVAGNGPGDVQERWQAMALTYEERVEQLRQQAPEALVRNAMDRTWLRREALSGAPQPDLAEIKRLTAYMMQLSADGVRLSHDFLVGYIQRGE